MPFKKPQNLTSLNTAFQRQESFTLTETGTFSKDGFQLKGKSGISQSPLGRGEVTVITLDQLQLGQVLGKGASSQVQLAVHVPTNKFLALKILTGAAFDQTCRQQVVNELKVVCDAHCDYLVAFYDAFFHQGNIYLALEYMNGGSLEDLIQRMGQTQLRVLPEDVLGQMMIQMLQGLIYLHKERHQLHRDLKPANVLINLSGEVKLSDFGIAKQMENTQAMALSFCGTAAYMSPERITGTEYSYPSDIWSLGLIAVECATGTYPYPQSNAYFDLVKNIVEGPIPAINPQVLPNLSPEFHNFVQCCLIKDPNQRPTALDLLAHPWIVKHSTNPYVSGQGGPTTLAGWLNQLAQWLHQGGSAS